MHPYFYFVLFIYCHIISSNADLSIQKCRKDDSNCLKNLVQSMITIVAEGDPQYGLHPLDPLDISHIDSSSSNLQLHINDITVTGLKGCVAKKVRYNTEKSSLFMKLMCSVDLNGDYEMKGKLLFLPIEGNGKIHVTLRKAIFGVDSILSHVVDEKGRNHLNVVDWSHSYDLKDQADLNFDNLFNGNEVLGKAAQDVIVNNSNEIILEVGSPIVKTIISKVVESVQELYHVIPLEDLIID